MGCLSLRSDRHCRPHHAMSRASWVRTAAPWLFCSTKADSLGEEDWLPAHRPALHGCGKASIHSSKKTRKALGQLGGRVVLHFLPPYCPQANRIERVWW